MDRTQESETPVTKYLKALFRELERLWPTSARPTSHAIAWDNEIEGLVLLINVGDCVFPYVLHPHDVTVATAENLVARGRFDLGKPDAENSQSSLRDQVVQFDATVIQIPRKGIPKTERIVDRCCSLGLRCQLGQGLFQPSSQVIEQRPGLR